MRAGAAALLLALAAASTGCGVLADLGPSTCDRSTEANPLTLYTEGTVEEGVYMSSPWDGELLYFPGGMRYEIRHKLEALPRWWEIYLSFDRYGAKTGTLALAAGDQAEVIEVTEEALLVVNASCVEYWLLVVASTGAQPPSGPGPGEPGAD
jgi:hypothetical protein